MPRISNRNRSMIHDAVASLRKFLESNDAVVSKLSRARLVRKSPAHNVHLVTHFIFAYTNDGRRASSAFVVSK